MTNEEAKEELLDMKRGVVADSWQDKALDVAIKALEATEQVNTSHSGVQMFPKGTFKAIYDNESVISTKVVTDYIKIHIHEIISESGRDLNEHTNQVLRSIIKGVEEYQESEG